MDLYTVIYCGGHQIRVDTPQGKRNCLANRATKQATTQDNIATKLTIMPVVSSLLTIQAAPDYNTEETTWAQTEQGTQQEDGLWKLRWETFHPSRGGISTGYRFSSIHPFTKRLERFQPYHVLCADASLCVTCAKNNLASKETEPPQIRLNGITPFEDIEVDFTEVKPCQGCKYLLVMICTSMGWVEAYPTMTKKAKEMAPCMLGLGYLWELDQIMGPHLWLSYSNWFAKQ